MLTSIELFTGAGGLALGVAAAGFQHRLLVEYNRDACQSLRQNLAFFTAGQAAGNAQFGCELHEGDVADVDFSLFRGHIDLIAAGAPCQPFSIGGKHRAHDDERNLFPNVFEAVREVAPRAVIIENVKGLLRDSFAPYVRYIEMQLSMPELLPRDPDDWQAHMKRLVRLSSRRPSPSHQLRYRVATRLLQAADYGVPQKRERAFIVALRHDVDATWAGVSATHSEDRLLYEQWVSGAYWERHHLRKPTPPERLARRLHRLREEGEPRTKAWLTVRDALSAHPALPEPRPRQEAVGFLNHVGQPGARTYPGHTGSPIDEPAKTLKAGVHGVPGGENCVRFMNGEVRYFTVREAARLQTFPDRYHLQGAWGEALRQLGNAVPVELAKAVAASVYHVLQRDAAVDELSAMSLNARRAKKRAIASA